jgi:hypothetical protein
LLDIVNDFDNEENLKESLEQIKIKEWIWWEWWEYLACQDLEKV